MDSGKSVLRIEPPLRCFSRDPGLAEGLDKSIGNSCQGSSGLQGSSPIISGWVGSFTPLGCQTCHLIGLSSACQWGLKPMERINWPEMFMKLFSRCNWRESCPDWADCLETALQWRNHTNIKRLGLYDIFNDQPGRSLNMRKKKPNQKQNSKWNNPLKAHLVAFYLFLSFLICIKAQCKCRLPPDRNPAFDCIFKPTILISSCTSFPWGVIKENMFVFLGIVPTSASAKI